jgi:hypothetical protein
MTWNPTEPDTLDLALEGLESEIAEVRAFAIRSLTRDRRTLRSWKLVAVDDIISYGAAWIVLFRTRASGRLKRITYRTTIVARKRTGGLVRLRETIVSIG